MSKKQQKNNKRRRDRRSGSGAFEFLELRRVLAAPSAIDDAFDGVENTSLTISAATLLDNDVLGDEPTDITALDMSTSAGGSVVDNFDGTYVYDPPAGYTGPDTFTYEITDIDGDSDTAVVTITVNQAFTDEVVVGGLDLPIGLIALPDGRMLIGEKDGEVQIVDPTDAVPATTTYLTIPNVETANERGVWDFALDPGF